MRTGTRPPRHQRRFAWPRPALGNSAEISHAESMNSELDRRSSELNRQSSELNRRSSELNRRSSELNRRSSGLNRRSSELNRRSSGLDRRSSELNRRSSGLDRRSSGLDRSGLELTEWECPSNEGRSELRQLRSQLPGAGSIGVSGCGRDRCGPLYG